MKIFCLDDDPKHLAVIQMTVGKEFNITCHLDSTTAIQAIRNGDYPIILLDIDMPGVNGMQILEALEKEDADHLVILVTGKGEEEYAVKAFHSQMVWRYLLKPYSPSVLTGILHEAIEHYDARYTQYSRSKSKNS